MRIDYDPGEECIEFQDGLKVQYRLIYGLLILNIGNAILNLYLRDWAISGLNILWTIIGILSLAGVLFMAFRKDLRHRIPLGEVVRLREKTFLGTRRFSLQLRNGKSRDIIGLKTPQDVRDLVQMMQQIGVQTA